MPDPTIFQRRISNLIPLLNQRISLLAEGCDADTDRSPARKEDNYVAFHYENGVQDFVELNEDKETLTPVLYFSG